MQSAACARKLFVPNKQRVVHGTERRCGAVIFRPISYSQTQNSLRKSKRRVAPHPSVRAARVGMSSKRISFAPAARVCAHAVWKVVVVGAEMRSTVFAHPCTSSPCRDDKRDAVLRQNVHRPYDLVVANDQRRYNRCGARDHR